MISLYSFTERWNDGKTFLTGMISVDIVHRGANAMTRKQTKEAKPMAAVETEARSSVRFELSSEDHARFRVEAAKEGLGMAAVARRLVEDYLSRRKTGGK
jgi:DNA-binding transcriptional LysR family regulator